ncbi:MAG: HNH endonuclease [Bacteroidetes bacterium]|nr:MAG: HNH endonuclease [Bacteroidota bacterium]
MANFSEEQIKKVWEKASIVSGNDSNVFRKDQCSAWISRQQYGNRKSSYGWEIDHITPESHGGSDELSNLRPLQWENNLSKSGGKLVCVVTAEKTENVKK